MKAWRDKEADAAPAVDDDQEGAQADSKEDASKESAEDQNQAGESEAAAEPAKKDSAASENKDDDQSGAKAEAEAEGDETAAEEEPSVEVAAKPISVAAKLKGVHRKIFRAAKANTYKATKTGTGFTGSFADFASWGGYPTAATAHPANVFLNAGGNGSIPKPSGNYTVGGGTCGAGAHTKLWRAEVDKQRETIKKALIATGQKPGVADRNAMKQLETANGGMGFKDLYLLDNWEGHHIQPCNWGGTDVATNIVFLKCTEHSPSTTWWEAKKAEILKLL